MKELLLIHATHDLSCAFGELANAARRYPDDTRLSSAWERARDLAAAAVAFTVQLAIDEAGRDPAEMRALERELISKLKSAVP